MKTFASSVGLTHLIEDTDTPANGAVNYTTSTYTSGWMPGDIKGAFLADTDTTSLVGGTDADRSVNNNPLTVNGTITRSPVATGAELVGYSGFSATNYLEQPYNPDLDFGTGDFCVMGWANVSVNATRTIFCRENIGATGAIILLRNVANGVEFYANTSITNAAFTSAPLPTNTPVFILAKRESGVLSIWQNGLLASNTPSVPIDLDNSTAVTRLGQRVSTSNPFDFGSLALFRISATAPTADQIRKIYEDEKYLFQENAACTLYGTSDAVTALAHDPATDLLHVGTSQGRSDFQGLRRVSHTTDPVTTAISASGGFIVEE